MKRDMDLIRKLLFEIEKKLPEKTAIGSDEIDIEGYNHEEIVYHLELLIEANLVLADEQSTFQEKFFFVRRLTWNGCEFLDAARNDNNWNRAKSLASKIGDFTFDLLKQILLDIAKQQLTGLIVSNLGS